MIAYALKKLFVHPFYRFKIMGKLLVNIGIVPVYHIMVAPDHMQPSLGMEFAKQLEYIFMRLKNGFKVEVFPKLIAIAQFTIVKTFPVIVVEGMEIDVSVVCKIVGKTVVTPMAVAKKNEL